MEPALALHDRAAVEVGGDRSGLERRRHDDDLQILGSGARRRFVVAGELRAVRGPEGLDVAHEPARLALDRELLEVRLAAGAADIDMGAYELQWSNYNP